MGKIKSNQATGLGYKSPVEKMTEFLAFSALFFLRTSPVQDDSEDRTTFGTLRLVKTSQNWF